MKRKFLIVIEKYKSTFSAYSPDVPGCIATGKTIKEVEKNIKGAIQFHLEGMKEENLEIPEPHTKAKYILAG